MAIVTVLGAGAMGSAICKPLSDAGWEVRLWGTWLDDHLLDAIEEGKAHPRTGAFVPESVKLYRSDALDAALADAEVVIMSVASVGVEGVAELALPGIAKAKALWLTSKGFHRDETGKIRLLPDALRMFAQKAGVELPPIVAIAGPVKANECAEGKPTATIFGSLTDGVARDYALRACTEVYAVAATTDEVGVEVCAPMKNVYAIGLGIADGLEEGTGIPRHNLKAAAFTQAVAEMSQLGQALGADPVTAFGLPGVGDLEVTALSGRNKVYGLRIGRGEKPSEALAEMERLEQTVEGVSALPYALELVAQTDGLQMEQFPLLAAISEILTTDGEVNPEVRVAQAVLPRI
ncbi:MAG: NAD(P)H-dependent glycerol-3-phosphate dehydrogenase [Arcanobacterium sp.]|nr:NAD(P)H-dependent glycerol-3-phosphate dehydrogenase [Arcanobacterium sp.]